MKVLKQHIVFLVEENDTYSFMLDYLISQETPCRIVRFKTVKEFIQSKEMKPSIIILDTEIREMDGLETLRRIESVYPDIPVILLTGKEDIDTAIHYVLNGAYDYLIKRKESILKMRDIIDQIIHSNNEIHKRVIEK